MTTIAHDYEWHGHSTISVGYLQERIGELQRQGRKQFFFEVNGKPVSNEAALMELENAYAAGRRAYGCPEPNPDGTCPGHKQGR